MGYIHSKLEKEECNFLKGKYFYYDDIYMENKYNDLDEDSDIKLLLNSSIEGYLSDLAFDFRMLDSYISDYISTLEHPAPYEESPNTYKGVIVYLIFYKLNNVKYNAENKNGYWEFIPFSYDDFMNEIGCNFPDFGLCGYNNIDKFIEKYKEINNYE